MVKQLYKILMEKYNWTVAEIDSQDFWRTLDLETGDWVKRIKHEKENPTVFIDDVDFL